MTNFTYQALDAEQRPTRGEIDADSVAHAVARLESLGLTVLAVGVESTAASGTALPSEAGAGGNPFAATPSTHAVEAEQRALLQSHMATVIERGRHIVPALRAYAAELPQGRRRKHLLHMLDVIDRGDVAEATVAMNALPSFWIALFSATATSQDPGRMLREFLRESRRTRELQRQWLLTLAYPAVLLTLALVVIVGLSLFLVPIFREIFMGFGLQLPWISRTVITISDWINSGQILVALVVAAAAVVLLWFARRWLPDKVAQRFSDSVGFRLGRATIIARFSQYAADLLEADMPPPQAARLAGIATGNSSMRRAAWRWAGHTSRSGPTVVATLHRRMLTSTVLYALEGEMPTRARVALLRVVSACHAATARRRLSWTHGIVEPIAICLVGALIGLTLLALLYPLLNLVSGIAS